MATLEKLGWTWLVAGIIAASSCSSTGDGGAGGTGAAGGTGGADYACAGGCLCFDAKSCPAWCELLQYTAPDGSTGVACTQPGFGGAGGSPVDAGSGGAADAGLD